MPQTIRYSRIKTNNIKRSVFLKKLLTLLLVAIMISLTACSSNESTSESSQNEENQQEFMEDDSTAENEEDDSSTDTDDKESTNAESYEVTYTSAKLYTSSIGTVWLQTIIEVENTGDSDLYLSAGAYDLEDDTGKLVSSQDLVSVYPSVISPGEKAYYYEETTVDDLDENTVLTVIPRPKVAQSKVDKIQFPISDFELKADEYNGVSMIGRVENNTDEEQTLVNIACILFDSENVPIGVIFTMLTEDFNASDKIGFEGTGFSLPPDVTMENVASHIEFAYPTQFQI